ncbi:HIT domain-containing protein [Patescibacteria group bacterium]|nr:HIT domain-containing protein [Patescibacteria group bacterium]
MEGCVFCKIAEGKQEADFLLKEDGLVVFRDIHPKAPFHVLVVPRKHIVSAKDLQEEDKELVGELVLAARKVAQEQGVEGYKLLVNVGKEGGQLVDHFHVHVLGNLPRITEESL